METPQLGIARSRCKAIAWDAVDSRGRTASTTTRSRIDVRPTERSTWV